MKKYLNDLFGSDNKEPLFQMMAKNHPDILLSLESIINCKLEVDEAYHQPKKYLQRQNTFTIILTAFIEISLKRDNISWLKDATKYFIEQNVENWAIIKSMRNKSLHQEHFVFSKEGSFVVGLYRIRPDRYQLKLGMGDLEKASIPEKYLFKNTESIFHNALLFHFLYFIDREHSDPWECLGITRRWLYEISYTFNKNKVKKTIDLHHFVNKFFQQYYNHICNTYAKNLNIKHKEYKFCLEEDHNFVNTLLEIDLYPFLFKKFWGEEVLPSNWNELLNYKNANQLYEKYNLYENIYINLAKNKKQLVDLLKKYETESAESLSNPEEFMNYICFTLFLHWNIFEKMKSKLLRLEKTKHSRLMSLIITIRELSQEMDQKFQSISIEEKTKALEAMSKYLKEFRTLIETI